MVKVYEVLSFGAGVCVGGVAVWYILHIQKLRQNLNNDSCKIKAGQLEQKWSIQKFEEDEILVEQLTRNIQFLGLKGQQAISNSFVIVVGLGGVGSHAAHMLLRSGVGKLRLIDFDQVTLSSLNRHAVAVRQDVGIPKVACMKNHMLEILPEANIEAVNQMYEADDSIADNLLSGNPDFVLDAIDNVDTKVHLLTYCYKKGIKVLSTAGAGAKIDPTRLRIADIAESSIDPLARAVRHKLRREHGISNGINILLSTEAPRCGLTEHESQNPLDLQIVPNFRVRTIPVLGPAPALFGIAAAAYVLCELAADGHQIHSEPIFKIHDSQYDIVLQRLIEREELNGNMEVQVDLEEVVWLIREVWRGLSAKLLGCPSFKSNKGLQRSLKNLTFVRWDKSKDTTADNLVLLNFQEADEHEHSQLSEMDPKYVEFVNRKLEFIRTELHT